MLSPSVLKAVRLRWYALRIYSIVIRNPLKVNQKQRVGVVIVEHISGTACRAPTKRVPVVHHSSARADLSRFTPARSGDHAGWKSSVRVVEMLC